MINYYLDEDRFWTFDNRTGRYRDRETGKFLSKQAVMALTEKNIALTKLEVDRQLQEVLRGERSLIDFSVRAAESVKKLHIQEYLLGRGGLANAQDAEYLAVGRSLKDLHYPALRRLTEDLRLGKLSPAQASARLNLIMAGSKQSYFYGERQSRVANGFAWARRYLSVAEHCQDCLNYAALGPVPITQLIPPATACACGGNCKCFVRYAQTREELLA